jgi:hypothetical protein
MGHLIKIRPGWQNEYLAEYLLSKFSFVAKPTTIGEDVGIDFFCVLYNLVDNKYLQPKFSFSIQIKSNQNRIDISKNADYYANLETPFFVGIIKQKTNSLDIYSGEGIQHFFTLIGNPRHENNKKWYNPSNKICFEYANESIDRTELFTTSDNLFIIKLPLVCSINSVSSQSEIDEIVKKITKVSSMIQKNICGFKSGSYVYDYFTGNKAIYAGPTSVKTYKENFILRLAELFYNLNWQFTNNNDIIREFKFHEKMFLEIKKLYPNEKSINLTENIYKELKKKIEPTAYNSGQKQ